jgi:hypothetical protein
MHVSKREPEQPCIVCAPALQTILLADCGNIEPIRGVIDIFEGPVGRKRIRSAPISSVASLAFASEITRSRQPEIVLREVLFKSYLASHVLSPNSNFFVRQFICICKLCG